MSLLFLAVCLGSLALAIAAFIAHRRLAGEGERAGVTAMLVFVFGWLALILALVTGLFLLSGSA